MIRNNMEEFRKQYESLFNSDELKARAFDKIAENYYFGNFGTMQKADIEVLLFSIYLEEILNQSEEDMNTYSDYTLAKQLGITQSKVSNLKIKKQLQYPYEGFDWKKSFKRICKNARYENGKIRINLRDKNLYYEIKNQIEKDGGYVEATLTSNLLIITPEEFLCLVELLMTEEEKDVLKKVLRKKYADNEKLCGELEKKPLGQAIRENFGETMVAVVCEIIKDMAPTPIGTGVKILQTAYNAILEKM